MKRFLAWPGTVFVAVLAWKFLLLLISTQPVPANDSFFYDGPVVNRLLHGQYVNPSLANALSISGTRFFSAYPPLYQMLLFPWMWAFGPSAPSAISFHLCLFAAWSLVVLAILRCLQTPAWGCHLAGCFLLVITFHDRPDSLAHLLGAAAIYGWVRGSFHSGATNRQSPWHWFMAAMVGLALGTSLQIGGLYFCLLWLGNLLLAPRRPVPILPLAAMTLTPACLVLLVIKGRPDLWAGFLEHASQTPSWTGFRLPNLADFLKIGRTVPAVFAIAILFPWLKGRCPASDADRSSAWHVCASTLLAALAVVAAALFVLTPNLVAIGAYLQPLIIGGYLAVGTGAQPSRSLRVQAAFLTALALLGSVRAMGMTTWGLACARDVSYTAAMQRVRAEVAEIPDGAPVGVSAAYLYEVAQSDRLRWLHSDWLGKADKNNPYRDCDALLAVKPAKLILTQFDYYRRYENVLAQFPASAGTFQIENMAQTPPPDAFNSLQKVIQHISWAPVIVMFNWH